MKNFSLFITKSVVYSTSLNIEAETEEEAIEKAKQMILNNEVDFDEDDDAELSFQTL